MFSHGIRHSLPEINADPLISSLTFFSFNAQTLKLVKIRHLYLPELSWYALWYLHNCQIRGSNPEDRSLIWNKL